MNFGKIIVKNDYENKGDLVLRSYVRAMKKSNLTPFIDGDNAVIYGVVKDDTLFHELLTDKVIDYDNIEYLSVDNINKLFGNEPWDINLARNIIRKLIFKEEILLNFEVSTIEEKAEDRAVEFKAYNESLSKVNPYMRLGEEQEDNNYFNYDNFSYKVRVLKRK